MLGDFRLYVWGTQYLRSRRAEMHFFYPQSYGRLVPILLNHMFFCFSTLLIELSCSTFLRVPPRFPLPVRLFNAAISVVRHVSQKPFRIPPLQHLKPADAMVNLGRLLFPGSEKVLS